jgi:hemerythrin-like metal-binding protein
MSSVFIQWRDEFSVNNETIDKQHKALISALAGLMDAMWAGKGKEELHKVIGFLVDYVEEHFNTEELYMAEIGYPAIDPHKEIHRRFIKHVSDFREKLYSGDVSTDTAINVFFDTWDWLKKHILKEDKMYSEYAKNRK